jgi:hypothetical protein
MNANPTLQGRIFESVQSLGTDCEIPVCLGNGFGDTFHGAALIFAIDEAFPASKGTVLLSEVRADQLFTI